MVLIDSDPRQQQEEDLFERRRQRCCCRRNKNTFYNNFASHRSFLLFGSTVVILLLISSKILFVPGNIIVATTSTNSSTSSNDGIIKEKEKEVEQQQQVQFDVQVLELRNLNIEEEVDKIVTSSSSLSSLKIRRKMVSVFEQLRQTYNNNNNNNEQFTYWTVQEYPNPTMHTEQCRSQTTMNKKGNDYSYYNFFCDPDSVLPSIPQIQIVQSTLQELNKKIKITIFNSTCTDGNGNDVTHALEEEQQQEVKQRSDFNRTKRVVDVQVAIALMKRVC